MNKRIKKLRKALDLTQQEFANRIGSTQNAVTGYETGRRNPSSSVINNICKEFHVNETWLRTGEGEMFREISREDEITDFINDVLREEPDDFRRRHNQGPGGRRRGGLRVRAPSAALPP